MNEESYYTLFTGEPDSIKEPIKVEIGQWATYMDTGLIPIPEGTSVDDILRGLDYLMMYGNRIKNSGKQKRVPRGTIPSAGDPYIPQSR